MLDLNGRHIALFSGGITMKATKNYNVYADNYSNGYKNLARVNYAVSRNGPL